MKRTLSIAALIIIASIAYRAQYTHALFAEARLYPLLPLSGTDPQSLRIATAELEQAVAALSSDADSREHLNHLYPTAFLRALADTEEARQRLLEERSFTHARQYESALTVMTEQGLAAAQEFDASLAELSDADMPSFYSLAGLVSPQSLTAAASSAVRFHEDAWKEHARRMLCRRVPVCSFGREQAPEQTVALAPDTTMAETFFLDVRTATQTPLSRRAILSESACLAELPSPHVFLSVTDKGVPDSERIHYVNDVLFLPTTSAPGGVMRHLSKTLSFAIQRPLPFYVCFETQRDRGLVAAIAEVLEIAESSPERARGERNVLLAEQSDIAARQYLSTALSSSLDLESRRRLEEARIMIDSRNAKLDALVKEIATVLTVRMRQARNGIPVRIDAQALFATHSAFPSLLLTHDASIVSAELGLATSSPTHRDTYLRSVIRLSQAPAALRASLVKDTRTLYRFDMH